MSQDLIHFIANYGYFALFMLIFSQEIGIPNPIPNELVLVYSGYLCSQGIFYFPSVILTVILADFVGTNILYFTFYFFGKPIIKRKPKWLPISEKGINKATDRISKNGLWAICVGRITPFIRGYTSIIAGILRINPKKFLPIALTSALVWSSVFVLTGKVLGNEWSIIIVSLKTFKFIIIPLVLGLIIYLTIRYYQKSKSNPSTK